MKPIHFEIRNINAIDSYLYAGNLFVIFGDYHIGYVSFDYIIHLLRKEYPLYDNILQWAFLHNDYTNTPSGRLLLGIDRVKNALDEEWQNAQEDIDFVIDYNQIASNFTNIGELSSMPLDMRLYAMRMYIACQNGLYESILTPQEKTKISSAPIEKIFDSKVVAVNARYGAIAISADKEGLFSSELLDIDSNIQVPDTALLRQPSYRSDWKDVDLLSYSGSNQFNYIRNEAEKTRKEQSYYYHMRNAHEFRRITQMGTEVTDMSPLLENLDIVDGDIDYCFNSGNSAFIRLKDGSFFVTDFSKRKNGPFRKDITEPQKGRKILSSGVIPNGCVLSYYDKTVMYKGNESIELSSDEIYGFRTYMNAIQYRSLITINHEHNLSIFSCEDFNPLPINNDDLSSLGRVRYSNVFRRSNVPNISDRLLSGDDLPF